jgi:3-hydroxybutyryl-CoA dehydrogenase
MTKRVAIIGAGLMGAGLALVFARSGREVCITDASADARASLFTRIDAMKAAIGDHTHMSGNIDLCPTVAEAVQGADLVIEAVSEKLDLKQDLFAEIERSVRDDTILASNTSVIPITNVMAKVNRKERALGTHWWNPPYLVPLVEVIQTEHTNPDVIAEVMALLKEIGKTPVHVKKDVPGFIGNRMQAALWREAISLVENGVCDAETVDLVVKSSFGARLAVLGPLENADLVGTDLALDIHNQVLADLEDSHRPSPYLQKLVADGKLGFKSGEGFKTWTREGIANLRGAVAAHLVKSFKNH